MAALGALIGLVNDGSNKVQGTTTGMLGGSANSLNQQMATANQGLPATGLDPAQSANAAGAMVGAPGSRSAGYGGGGGQVGSPGTAGGAAPAAGNYGFGDFMRDMFNKTPVGQAYNAVTDNSNVVKKAQPVDQNAVNATQQSINNGTMPTSPNQNAPQQPTSAWQNISNMTNSLFS